MPAPPKPNESRDTFMNRCIPILIDEGRNQDEAVAICSSIWDASKEEIDIEIED